MTPCISVIMAVFNGQSTIFRAIQSICEQSYSDWEMIIVDDASTDDTRMVIHDFVQANPEYADRITVLHNLDNRGLAYSLNYAIENSTGQYLARMDADDISCATRLEKQSTFLDENTEVDVVGSFAYRILKGGSDGCEIQKMQFHEDIVNQIHKANPFIHSSVMIRRHFLEKVGLYDESFLRAQDYELWLRGYYMGARYYNIPDFLVYYNVVPAQSFGSIYCSLRVRLKYAPKGKRIVNNYFLACAIFTTGLLAKLGLFRPAISR